MFVHNTNVSQWNHDTQDTEMMVWTLSNSAKHEGWVKKLLRLGYEDATDRLQEYAELNSIFTGPSVNWLQVLNAFRR